MANVIVQGRIGRVSSKPFKDNRTGEDILLHSFQLEGKNTWYRTGQRPVPAGVGQDVRFVADDVKVDVGTFEVTQAQVAQAPSVAATAGATTTATISSSAQSTAAPPARSTVVNKDDYWARKEAKDEAK